MRSLIGVAVGVLVAWPAAAQDALRCVQVYEVQRGKQCNSSTSLSYRLRNTCAQAIDMKYCSEERSGRWRCGQWSNTRPNESTSYYICDATGEYRYWARVAGSKASFPPDPR